MAAENMDNNTGHGDSKSLRKKKMKKVKEEEEEKRLKRESKKRKREAKQRTSEEDGEADLKSSTNVETKSSDNNVESNKDQKPVDGTDGTDVVKKKAKTNVTSTSSSSKERRLQRMALLEKVPKVDENGIMYTKQQIRRMIKRMAKGLHPVETPAEKHARLQAEAQLRKEEEAELAGLIVTKTTATTNKDLSKLNEGSDDDDDDDINNDNDEEPVEADDDDLEVGATTAKPNGAAGFASQHDEDDEHHIGIDDDPYSYEKTPKSATETLAEKPPPNKKKPKRNKPVPNDYICSACQQQGNHWIYDCTMKQTVRGTNQVSRKQRGLHNPSENKVFVSGLPFDTTVKDVTQLFTTSLLAADTKNNGATKKNDTKHNSSAEVVVHCKLIKFADTGRCKGQAFVTFATADAAKAALKLNGMVVGGGANNDEVDDKNDKSKNAHINKKQKQQQQLQESVSTKELKLKVTKVLNRFLTKSMKQKP